MQRHLFIVLLSVLLLSTYTQDLPLGQQLIDSCLLPDITDMVSCYQDSDCASLLDSYQQCYGTSSNEITASMLETMQSCINQYQDTDNTAFSQILTDEQSCINVMTQIEDSPDALSEFDYCKKKSKKHAKKDVQLGVCALGCFLQTTSSNSSSDDNSLLQDSGKACVLQCYLNSSTFAKYQRCMEDVTLVYSDSIQLALKKYKKKLLKKNFEEEEQETLGQQMVNNCLVPAMTTTAACLSDSDCSVLAGQMHDCLQSQDPGDVDGKQQCVDQYSTTNNAPLQKLIQVTEACLSIESQLMENPTALQEAQQCNSTFSNSILNDPNLPTCMFGCMSTGNKSCIVDCITNTQEFTDLENCLDDITLKYDLQSVKKLMKNKAFYEDDDVLVGTTNSTETDFNLTNGTFGQILVDNCLTPAISAEMKCLGDPDCPYLAKALGKCMKNAGDTNFDGQSACLTQFSGTLNSNFYSLISISQTCVDYDEQLYTNSYAFDEAKKCQKSFKKSVKYDLSVVECTSECQQEQFTAGPCNIQCVLNSTSYSDFQSCIEGIDLNDTAPMRFGDYYMSTCLFPTMTDMISCLQDTQCPSLEQQLLLSCNQGEAKLADYNFTEGQSCLTSFDTQENIVFENVVIDMENCLSLFSQIQGNKKALKQFKKCNQTFENEISSDYDMGQCYMGCSSDSQAGTNVTDCLIQCIQQSSELTDFQQCLNEGIPLSMNYEPFSQLSFMQTKQRFNVAIENIDSTSDSATSNSDDSATTGSNKIAVTNILLAIILIVFMIFI